MKFRGVTEGFWKDYGILNLDGLGRCFPQGPKILHGLGNGNSGKNRNE